MSRASKILVCVALVCATTTSTDERYRRVDLTDIGTSFPHQWQLTNSLNDRRLTNDVGTRNFNILRIDSNNRNLNGRHDQNDQLDNAQSGRKFNIQQLPLQGSVNLGSLLDARPGRQLTNERYIGGLQRGNGYSGQGKYIFGLSSQGRQRSWGRQNGQRQAQFSEGLRNSQNLQITTGNVIKPSVGANQIPFLGGTFNYNQEQAPEIRGESVNSYGGLNAQPEGIVGSSQFIGYNKNLIGQRPTLSGNIQQNPSLSQWNNNGIYTGLVKNQGLAPISTGSIFQGIDNASQEEVGQDAQINTQNNNQGGYYSQNSAFEGNRESSLQLQTGRNFNHLGLNKLRGIQSGLLGNNAGRQQYVFSNSQIRDESGIDTASRPEEEGTNQNLRSNLETSLDSYQPQRDINQNNIAQQQTNSYTYSELNGKIWKVIQSNPSIISNMNGLAEQLLSNEDSGNQQIRQLKSLLQEMGKYSRNPSSSGISVNGSGQQNTIIRNLLEVMNDHNRSNFPVSYQGLNGWRS